MAEINAQWSNEEDRPSDDFPDQPQNMDTGFEEVTEDEANSSMKGLSLSDPANHSLPNPEPRKPYGKHQTEILKRRCIIWGVAALLIVGVVGAFVGGFLSGEQREGGGQMSGISDSTATAGGESAGGGGTAEGGKGGQVPVASLNYRRTRRMTKKRRRVNVRGHQDSAGTADKSFELTQVFGVGGA